MRIIFLLLVVSYQSLFSQQYKIQHFIEQGYLSGSYIYTITQDESGFLWLGTSKGLYKYDGFNFQHFVRADSLADNFITSSINHNGVLWLGHKNGKITAYSKDVGFKIVDLEVDNPSSIMQFKVDDENKLWIATYSNGLFWIDENQKIKEVKFDNNILSIHAFHFVNKSNLLLGSDDGLYYCNLESGKKIQIEKHLVEIPKTKISSIELISNNVFAIATESKGVYRLALTGNRIKIDQLLGNHEIGDNMVSALLFDKKLNMWVGTLGNGLMMVKCNGVGDKIGDVKWFTEETSDYVKTLFSDREENIWIGNYGEGVSMLSRNPFSRKYHNVEGFGESVYGISGKGDEYWIGTQNGVVLLNKLEEILGVYDINKGLPDDRITTVYRADDGTIWAGTFKSGIYILKPGEEKFEPFFLSTGILENSITALDGTDNEVWAGTRKGLVRIDYKLNEVKWFNIRVGGLPHNVVNDIFIDEIDKVWISTQSNVLSYYYKGKISKIEVPVDNGSFILNAITKDSDGGIWVGSNGMGVFRIGKDSTLNIREEEGLFTNYCYSIIADKDGYIWLTHRGGISRIDPKTLSVRAIQKYAGLTNDDKFNVNAISVSRVGAIHFGTNRGIIEYDPENDTDELYSPLLQLLAIKVNDEEIEAHNKVKLPAGRYKLGFEYIGVCLKEPEDVKYQYRLKGYDPDWSEISRKRTVTYNNLISGRYLFELHASSGEGVTSEPLQVSIVIMKPIWSHWWFYVLSFGILTFSIVAYIKRREYKLIQDKRQLEKRVRERTQEIQQKTDEIQRQGQLIYKKNLDITDSIKYAWQIQRAIFPPENVLKDSLRDYFLINKPKDIVSGDFCWYSKKNGKYIIALTDCTGHGVPGAFMSMLGITLFNEVVNTQGVTDSVEILELLREKVIAALNQHPREYPSYDGMNVGLCVIDPRKQLIQYSGAYHNLIHFQSNELNIVKAERTPVGYTPLGTPAFVSHEISYKKGDVFYLYSDGYQDQFGGEGERKFTHKRLLDTLVSVQGKSMLDQKIFLERTLSEWMKNVEQTDDIIFLGCML